MIYVREVFGILIMTKVSINSQDYELDKLSEKARVAIIQLEYIDKKFNNLSNMLALLENGRASYLERLKKEMLSKKSGIIFDQD